MASGYRSPQQMEYQQAVQFLTWDQFPKVMDKGIKYFSVIPQIGIYQHFNPSIKPFDESLLGQTERDFTLSGVGSLFDFDKFGRHIHRPSPQLAGSGCDGTSLCLDPICFGFTEGVIENSNTLQNMCWELSMPCLKDHYYSDRKFDLKMKRYFEMYFMQGPAVAQAYQRTRLLQESIKVVCTDKNFRFSGPVIGGTDGQSLPFYIDPLNPTAFPDMSTVNAGIGGANLMAFMQYVAPRLFGNSWDGGMEGIKAYGLKHDYMIAKEQTASVMDSYMDQEILSALRSRGMDSSGDKIDSMMGEFIHDGLFPTFKNVGGSIIPITQEILEASTIAGYVQTSNPEHALGRLRGILLVPNNIKFDLVEPPKDDFSYLGLGQGLNFRSNTPGVFPIMSSSLFANNTMSGKQVVIGQAVGADGMVRQNVSGLQRRDKAISEAIRTELMMTYAGMQSNNANSGQLPNVGSSLVPQGRADGFALKSTMYVGTDFRGTAKPVLLLFKTDSPRSAKPIEVCDVQEVTVNPTGGNVIVDACPSGKIYTVLSFRNAVGSAFLVNDSATYFSGNRGQAYLVTVTAVSGNTVTIESTDGTTILPVCAGGSDDYGVRAMLLRNTGATATSATIIKAKYDSGSSSIFLGLSRPVVAHILGYAATITLRTGEVINVKLKAATTAPGVFVQVEAASGETCDLGNLDCACLMQAVFSY